MNQILINEVSSNLNIERLGCQTVLKLIYERSTAYHSYPGIEEEATRGLDEVQIGNIQEEYTP